MSGHYTPLLTTLTTWQPFRINAHGLVAMLGPDEVNMAVGRLVWKI